MAEFCAKRQSLISFTAFKEVEEINFDLGDDTSLFKLANKFDISTQAMSFRLANLNIF